MTDITTDTTEATDAATDEASPVEQEAVPDEQPTDEGSKAAREAAKYRTRLRETEAQRDELAGKVETWQRIHAEQLAAGILADPADLWRDGLSHADVLDDDGTVVAAEVEKAARALLNAHPHWGVHNKPSKPAAQLKSGASAKDDTADTGKGWAGVLGRGDDR